MTKNSTNALFIQLFTTAADHLASSVVQLHPKAGLYTYA